MSKEMKKLVEEIGQIVTESISALLAPSTDEEYSRVKREISNRLIARIGKAYANGLELPREMARWEWPTVASPNPGLKPWVEWIASKGAKTFIALREEGKE